MARPQSADDPGVRRWGGRLTRTREPELARIDAEAARDDHSAYVAERLAEQYHDGHPEGCSW